MERTIEQAVIKKLTDRGDIGQAKYGTTMDRKDLTFEQWATHAQEGMLDGAQYLERVIQGERLLERARQLLSKVTKGTDQSLNLMDDADEWLVTYENQFGKVGQ